MRLMIVYKNCAVTIFLTPRVMLCWLFLSPRYIFVCTTCEGVISLWWRRKYAPAVHIFNLLIVDNYLFNQHCRIPNFATFSTGSKTYWAASTICSEPSNFHPKFSFVYRTSEDSLVRDVCVLNFLKMFFYLIRNSYKTKDF